MGIYPAIEPLGSASRLGPEIVGEEHYRTRDVQDTAALYRPARHHCHSRHGGAGDDDQPLFLALERSNDSCLSRCRSPRCSPAVRVSTCSLKDTIAGFKGIMAGEYDHMPEQAFYMVGGIEEAVEKAEQL